MITKKTNPYKYVVDLNTPHYSQKDFIISLMNTLQDELHTHPDERKKVRNEIYEIETIDYYGDEFFQHMIEVYDKYYGEYILFIK